jgi:hypothetical protein
MRSRIVSLLIVASLVVPSSRVPAQACLAGASPLYLTGPGGDSIEIVGPSLLAVRDGVMIAGSGAIVFGDGKAVVKEPLRIVRVQGASTIAIGNPAEFGRYIYPRLVDDASGAIHLLWGESDSALSLPKQRPAVYERAGWPNVIWHATYRNGRWSRALRHRQLDGMAWYDVTPTRASGRYAAVAAVSHVGRLAGLVDIYFADADQWRTRTLNVGGLPVYSSVAPLKNGLMVGFITGSSGAERRSKNTVYITDSLATDSSWSTPVALGTLGDQHATMLSLVRSNESTVNAVWGQSLTDRLEPDVIRIVPLDVRGRPRAAAQDLGGSGALKSLHAESDARGGTHVVFQRYGDETTMAYYAHWSPRSGWSRPVALSDARYSRDPAIVAQSNDSLAITYSAYVGMLGTFPRFATAILRVGSGASCAH